MRVSPHRTVSVLVLVVWMAPAVFGFGVALHVALDHHGPHDGDGSQATREPTRTVDHGHHHDLTAALGHEHEARIEERALALRPGTFFAAVVPAPASVEAAPMERTCLVGSPRRAPPDPLFRIHCSLLL